MSDLRVDEIILKVIIAAGKPVFPAAGFYL